jgi:hypothetical protein
MSSTWEEPEEGAPTEAPSPSDAPTGGDDDQKTNPKQAEKNRAEDPPA